LKDDIVWNESKAAYDPQYFINETILMTDNEIDFKFTPKKGGRFIMFEYINHYE